jgi:arylsulfatase A-like enzyme
MTAAYQRCLVAAKIAAAVMLATGLDLLVAAAGGWTLRTDVARTVAMEAVLLLPVTIPFVLLRELAVARRSRRRPWLGTAAAAMLGALMLAGAIAMPLNGRSMLREPIQRDAPSASAKRPNLLLVVLDTMRADHLGVYGYPRPTSPWLDGFAKRAIVFETAISPSTWTLPAHATLFTGLFPRTHGADIVPSGTGTSLARLGRDTTDSTDVRPLPAEAVTLAELAGRAGMETGAICANSAYLHRPFGLDQGFDTYVDPVGSNRSRRPIGLALGDWLGLDRHEAFRRLIVANERSYLLAPEVNALALRWLAARRDRRFFLFLNYMETHGTRVPPSGYRRLFPGAESPARVDVDVIRSRTRPISHAEREGLVGVYDASVRYLDAELRRLFAALESQRLLDHTVVVIVSDHGESLGEHNEISHGNGAYATEVRVPLLLRLPGRRAGRRVAEVVHLADVLPTLVDLLALEAPPGVQGASLLGAERPFPAVSFTAPYRDLAIAHPRYYQRSHYAIYRDPWVLISRSDGERELYDFRADPNEERDLATTRATVVTELSAELGRFEDEVRPRFEHEAAPLDEETRRRLRALGYLN